MEKKILNVGCGGQTYGTHRVDFFNTKTSTEVANLEKELPYKDDMFDEVYCKSVLEHIKNIGLLISEMRRVLKPGGKIWLRTDYAGYLPMYLFKTHEHNTLVDNKYDFPEDHHYHLFVDSHIKYLFKDFKNLKISHFYGGRNKFIRFILKSLPFKLGVLHIELTAEK